MEKTLRGCDVMGGRRTLRRWLPRRRSAQRQRRSWNGGWRRWRPSWRRAGLLWQRPSQRLLVGRAQIYASRCADALSQRQNNRQLMTSSQCISVACSVVVSITVGCHVLDEDGLVQAGGATASGPALGNGYEIILQGFNWESHRQQWYQVGCSCALVFLSSPLASPTG